jgi:hypothetical protein
MTLMVALHELTFLLFTLSTKFRNQQVAGSIPAGGSIKINHLEKLAGQPAVVFAVVSKLIASLPTPYSQKTHAAFR